MTSSSHWAVALPPKTVSDEDAVKVLKRYYQNDFVRARIVEFLGATFLDEATCAYIVGFNGDDWRPDVVRPPAELPSSLNGCCDISRSLWDRRALVAHLDIEYVNFDYPGEVYLNPQRAFHVQRPVVRTVQELLLQWSISPLHLLTGRGHHFIWTIDRNSTAFRRLAELGRVPPSLQQSYEQSHPPHNERIDAELGRAFAGLGLLMEYIGHLVKQNTAGKSRVSVQLTDVEVGDDHRGGRDVVSVDLSEYADPLQTRFIRVPFSVYFKPQRDRAKLGDHVVDTIPLIFEIPLFEMSEDEAIGVMRDANRVADLAARAPVRIPSQTAETEALLSEYRSSSLSHFHDWFYQLEQHSPEQWPQTYDRVDLDLLPSCIRQILQKPNDLLLKPAGIQHVVRVFLALGWHPRHIAGLIRSKYERDFGWGDCWFHCDATHRADSYTRLFAGLVATGLDRLVDFNCVSNREKGYCFQPECGHNLADYRDALIRRKDHERLGCRPFNRLFLPNEHL